MTLPNLIDLRDSPAFKLDLSYRDGQPGTESTEQLPVERSAKKSDKTPKNFKVTFMKFNSRICTTREQSQKLLALGLKPETADMVYHHTSSKTPDWEWELQARRPTTKKTTVMRLGRLNVCGRYKRPDGTPMSGEEVFDKIWGQDIPAWSLSRLLEMLPVTITQKHDAEAHWEFCTDGSATVVLYTILGYDTLFSSKSDNIFDAMIETMEWLVTNGHFNKEYLEEQS